MTLFGTVKHSPPAKLIADFSPIATLPTYLFTTPNESTITVKNHIMECLIDI